MVQTPPIPHSYAYARELNQSATLFVKIGRYDRAISALTKCLRMWKKRDVKDQNAGSENEDCFCQKCNPSGCTRFSEYDCVEIDTRVSTPNGIYDDSEYQTGFNSGYLYQKLVQIPCKHLFENQNITSAVPLIILFNLAITHHISASRSNSMSMMNKTLKLYQLANKCLNQYITDTHNCCTCDETGIMFQMILLNNLSHLHSFMGDHLMSRRCIEQLIPIIMCVVDDKVRNIKCQSVDIRYNMSLEGFFRNISPLVLTAQCADAA